MAPRNCAGQMSRVTFCQGKQYRTKATFVIEWILTRYLCLLNGRQSFQL
jgi:hypothetical protein